MRTNQVRSLFGAVGDRGVPREFDVVVGADGQHSRCVNSPSVDNPLGLRDQAMLYNEPGRGAAMFRARGNQRAKVVLLFRSLPSTSTSAIREVSASCCDGDSTGSIGREHVSSMRYPTRTTSTSTR